MNAAAGHPLGQLTRILAVAGFCGAVFLAAASSPKTVGGVVSSVDTDTLRAPQVKISTLGLTEDTAGQFQIDSTVVSDGVLDSVRVRAGNDVVADVRIQGDILHINPVPDSSGAFTLHFFASNEDTSVVVEVEGYVDPRTDFRLGGLESNETDRRRPGLVRIFDRENVLMVEIRSDETGRFPPAQLPDNRLEYVAQAVITRDSLPFGYARMVRLPLHRLGDDIELARIRAIPFDGLQEQELSPAAFRSHVIQVTDGRIQRWDVEASAGVSILDRSKSGRFSRSVAERIRQLWSDPAALPRFTDGARLRIVSGPDSDPGAAIDEDGSVLRARPGWIIIAPDETLETSSASTVNDFDGDGVLDAAVVLLNPTRAESFGGIDRFITYEAGRVLGMIGRVDALSFAQTVMVTGIGPQVPEAPTFVDIKTAAILYEPDFEPLSDVNGVLGMQFYMPVAETAED